MREGKRRRVRPGRGRLVTVLDKSGDNENKREEPLLILCSVARRKKEAEEENGRETEKKLGRKMGR